MYFLPMTSSGIEPATFGFIAQHLNHCATAIPSLWRKVKLKWSPYRSGVAQNLDRGIALLFHDRGIRRVWVISSTLRPYVTPWKDPVPILQRLGGPQGRSGGAENLAPTRIRSRTVQPAVSRYTNWANRPIIFIT